MTGTTKIEWTDKSWNPIVGCSVVSPGCTNCYAMRFAGQRLDGNAKAPHYAGTTQASKAGAVWTGKVALASEKTLLAPLSWKKPAMIFVNSMGDLFHESVPDEWIDRVFAVMALAPQHTFQVLTKRAERMRQYFAGIPEQPNFPEARSALIEGSAQAIYNDMTGEDPSMWLAVHTPLPNVWLGVSAEDQARADERIPTLFGTPAAVRFVSAEPLLGAIDLTLDSLVCELCSWCEETGYTEPDTGAFICNRCDSTGKSDEWGIDWIIVGGESGKGARPMHPDWVRSIRDQCAAAKVPFFFKQWGEWLPWMPEHGPCWVAQNGRSEDSHVLFPTDLDSDQKWDDGLWGIAENLTHVAFQRVGKKTAGRLLDGATHDGMPSVHMHGETHDSMPGIRARHA